MTGADRAHPDRTTMLGSWQRRRRTRRTRRRRRTRRTRTATCLQSSCQRTQHRRPHRQHRPPPTSLPPSVWPAARRISKTRQRLAVRGPQQTVPASSQLTIAHQAPQGSCGGNVLACSAADHRWRVRSPKRRQQDGQAGAPKRARRPSAKGKYRHEAETAEGDDEALYNGRYVGACGVVCTHLSP